MRLPVVMLPSLMLLGVALALHVAGEPSPNVAASAVAPQDEGTLRQEQQAISDRLSRLRMERRHLVARGGI